jgi:hypothetical protein
MSQQNSTKLLVLEIITNSPYIYYRQSYVLSLYKEVLMPDKIIKVNNPPDLFDEKKKVIIRLNAFLRKYAEVNSIEYKLLRHEVRNFSGSFIELLSLHLDLSDGSSVWSRVYRNLFVPTLDSLLYDSIFPSEATVKLFNIEWSKLQKQSEEVFSTPINSSDNSKSFVW